jgi:photosystem II stability/assembly factor-like uncharacterized protein
VHRSIFTVALLLLPAAPNAVNGRDVRTGDKKLRNPHNGFASHDAATHRRSRVARAAAAPLNAPPIVQQFAETSYYLRDIAMIDANTGWAVGEPHWDQSAKQYKGTIVKTKDGGQTWTPQDAVAPEAFFGVHFVDANQGWVGGTNGTILHTSDGGAHWVRQMVATTDKFDGVVFTDTNTGWATAVRPVHYDDIGEPDDWRASIWHTSDGGQTWAQQQVPGDVSLLSRIDFVDSQTGWTVGVKLVGYEANWWPQQHGAIYHTTDGGRTWTEQYSPELAMSFKAVDFVDANNGWVAGFVTESSIQGGVMYHTTDGGKTWARQTLGSACTHNLWDLQFVDRSRGYAVGTMYGAAWGPPVCRTTDGGATWTDIIMDKRDNEGLYGVAVVGNQVIAVGDHDYLAKSTTAWDTGEGQFSCFNNACLFSQSYLNTHYLLYDVFFTGETHGCAVGSKTYQVELWGQVILCTADGGLTWATQYEHAPRLDELFSYHRLEKLYFADSQNGWAVERAHMMRTADLIQESSTPLTAACIGTSRETNSTPTGRPNSPRCSFSTPLKDGPFAPATFRVRTYSWPTPPTEGTTGIWWIRESRAT